MSEKMEGFLRYSKDCLRKLDQFTEVRVVLGNEACDLDSMVSSVIYAFYIYKTLPDIPGKLAIVPVFNIPKEDFHLRTEAVYMFKRFGPSDLGLFTFIDDINLQDLLEARKLRLILVDHNILAQHQKHMDVAVVEIIDHHKDQWPVNLTVNKTIELVGSCCSLVAQKMLTLDVLDSQMLGLLSGTILLDTVNMDPRAGRVTETDKQVVTRLQSLHKMELDELCKSVSKAKFDISGLSTWDLLRRDFKALPKKDKALSVGISSISGTSLRAFFARELVQDDILQYCQEKSLDVLVIMLIYFLENLDEPPRRQLAVCGPHVEGRTRVAEHLSVSEELKLKQFDECYEACFAYDQENITATRKVVFPLVNSFIEQKFN